MNPKQKMILVNAGVAGGLVVSYFRGAPLWIIALCGIFLFALVNLLLRIQSRKAQANDSKSN